MSSEITKKTVKEQLEERKINLDHVLAFSEDNQEFYTVEAVAVVFDSLVAELKQRLWDANVEQGEWWTEKQEGEIENLKWVLGLLGAEQI